MRERPPVDLTQPRTATGMFTTTFALYFAYPALFVIPAAVVLVPYQLILLSIRSSALITAQGKVTGTLLVVALIDLVVILPLVAVFVMQALVGVAERERPRLSEVFSQALPLFPGVAAAQIVAAALVFGGLFLLIVPGVIIAIKLATVAQTAAFEGSSWPTSIRRAWRLSDRSFFHILATLIVTGVLLFALTVIPSAIASAAGSAVEDTVTIVIEVFVQSFGVLMLSLLYFDLRVREA